MGVYLYGGLAFSGVDEVRRGVRHPVALVGAWGRQVDLAPSRRHWRYAALLDRKLHALRCQDISGTYLAIEEWRVNGGVGDGRRAIVW